ncbi:uncharacterized protein LOC133271815 [Pezoporus flaviventris]|uniref:uncharacterized protein LOC133271815 n=1 Tax=Pezoporus flaviventris TaxID=889875 RepID=UPI002AB2805E|nr:uncharacterized protein LOC133271815 [Pezoporus flaviventris]
MDCWALESHQRWLCREKQQGLFSHVSPCRSLLPGPRHHRLCDITAVHPRDTGEHPLVPTVSQRQQPLLPDCWDWAWFSRAVAAERTVGPGPTAEMEWEPAPAPAPSLCAPHALGQSADTAAAGPSGQGQTAPCDTAAAATQEERDVQPSSEGHDTVRIPPLSNRSRGPASEFSGLGFPQRLWKILESSEFRSIWWGMGGKCVAISEELFQQEVLGRVFSTQKMNSFLRQLYNYGFTRVHPDSQRSASLPEFLAEEAAASSHSKVLYYHSPSFSRERPQLLEQHKRKAAIKRKAPGAAQEEEKHPPRSADAQPAVHTRASPPAKRRNGALPGPSTARPSPRAAAPSSPEPARAAGSKSFIPPNHFFPPPWCPAGKLPKWAPRWPTLQPSPLLPADPLLAASRHSTVPSLPTALQQSFMDCWALESHQRWLCREKQQGLFSHVSPCRSLLPGPRHHRLCDITAVHPRDTGEHPLVPTVSQRQQPLLPDCWDWAWFSRAVAAERTVGPGPTAEMEWEPAPAPAPSLCAPHALGQSADTAAAGPSGQGQTAPCDTAAAATQEERDVQPGSEGHDTVRIPPLSNRSRGPASEFSGLGFPQRLWKILESSEFRSIWWGMGGKCVAISEELFQQEVLGRVFSTQKMNSFLRQLYNYGFTRVHPDSQRSASLPEFLAEEAAASSHSKVLYYHSPSFSRERPQLLEQHKRKAAIKRKAPGAAQEEEKHPPRSADAQPAVHTRASPPAKRRNGALPGPSTACPSPRAAAPSSPEPARAAGSKSFIPPNHFFPPPW